MCSDGSSNSCDTCASGYSFKTPAQITAGYDHTCALADGKAYCWGYNTLGSLGNNSTAHSLVPVAVDTSGVLSGKTVTQISAGSGHTCALADGKAYCWGSNHYAQYNAGQLGNNSTTESFVPVAVDTSGVLSGKTVTQISAGGGHTCALADGKAYCWGGSSYTATTGSVPVAVDTSGVLSGKTVTQVVVGHSHACVLADGKAYCWGYNTLGSLGNNSTAHSSVPVAVYTSGVLSGKTVTQMEGGVAHECVLADGKAYCWGYNYYGQLGNNSTTNSLVPVAVITSGVLSGKTITQISGGNDHTCALADGEIYCWGYNNYGELGNNSTTDSHVPVATVFTQLCYPQ
jgi:alpha-tubulin suppressor-like RCC1 family protein